MKFIRKGKEPSALRAWRLKQKSSPQNLVYEAIDGDALGKVREALLLEQGYLCAYTMLRIASPNDGHLEHIIAQSKSHGSDWSVRFSNMVYCHPGKDAPRSDFGAHCKDGRTTSQADFVSPLDKTCETRFVFERDGSVAAARLDDVAARKTIVTLNLDCRLLQQARAAAIGRLPISSATGRRCSAKQAQRLARELLEADAEGKFQTFAVALAQIAARYAIRQAAKEAALSAP